jgi:hypothetical protein
MAYNPMTGEYKEEDSSVSGRMNGLMRRSNPYMQGVEAQGAKEVRRRGLGSSTMATQAVEAARINAVLPIASQEAGQAHQSNQQGLDQRNQNFMQGRDITSREGMQTRDIDANRTNLDTELGSRERMQQADLGSRTLDREAQDRIARMNVASGERQSASQLAASFEQSYSQVVSNIMNNPEIPAEARQTYLQHAVRVRDSNLQLVEQMYGIQLDWGTNTVPNLPPVPGVQPTGGNTANNTNTGGGLSRGGVTVIPNSGPPNPTQITGRDLEAESRRAAIDAQRTQQPAAAHPALRPGLSAAPNAPTYSGPTYGPEWEAEQRRRLGAGR